MTLALVTTSCEKYDDYDTDRPTVVGFTTKNKNINGIAQGATKSTTVDVYASDAADVDRTFDIVLMEIDDPAEFPPTAAENIGEFDQTVTIPANENVGTITVSGKNVSLTSDRTYYRLSVKNSGDVIAGGAITIGLKK